MIQQDDFPIMRTELSDQRPFAVALTQTDVDVQQVVKPIA